MKIKPPNVTEISREQLRILKIKGSKPMQVKSLVAKANEIALHSETNEQIDRITMADALRKRLDSI